MNMGFDKTTINLQYNNKFSPGYQYTPENIINPRIVVLCHGNYQNGKDAPFMISLAEKLVKSGYIVISFDNLCYNKGWKPDYSPNPEEIDFRWAAFAAISYIEKNIAHYSRITLMGHSMGATIALAVGAVDDRIDSIISISPTRVSRFIFDEDKLNDFWNENIVKRIDTQMDCNMTRIVRSVLVEENYVPFLKNKPVLLIYGRKERFWGYEEWIESLSERIGEFCIAVSVARAGHYYGKFPDRLNQDAFEKLSEQIVNWLDQQSIKELS